MPDGDIVHKGLRPRYQKPYKWLCEGTATSDECARILLQKLKQDLKSKGDLPISLAQAMEARISQVAGVVDTIKDSHCAKLSIEFDNLIQQTDGRPDLKELVLRAGKSFLNDLRHQREVDTTNSSADILRRYMYEVYESEFKERIPLTSEHYAGVTQEVLENRIEAMQSSIDFGINKFTQKAIRDKSVSKISMPRRSSRNAIDLDEDLLGV